MRIVVAPDSMGGLLSAREVADAVTRGWRATRPDDEVVPTPMSDGGEGLLDVLHREDDRRLDVEVAGPLGHPVDAHLWIRDDGTAVVESASACGLGLLSPDRRDPMRATTYGVGELLDAARRAGASRVLLGLGGSATVDGGAGALTGLGHRLTVADGSGLKVGAADLHRVAHVDRGWRDPAWETLEVLLLADVTTTLLDAARTFGPQKGATADEVVRLELALARWREVVDADLGRGTVADASGAGAAGGLAFGLAAALPAARIVPGSVAVADELGLDRALDGADVVITGEGRLDATSHQGKVVGEVAARARTAGARPVVIAGAVDGDHDDLLVERAPATDTAGAREAVEAAAARVARRLGSTG